MKKLKILITGVAGFIGSHIADMFIKEGHICHGIDNLVTGNIENVNPKCKFMKDDFKHSGYYFAKHKKGYFDLVVHCAAQVDVRFSIEHPKEDCENNVLKTVELLNDMIEFGVKKIIFLSTGGALYDFYDENPKSEFDILKPLSPYAVSKLACEHYIKYYSKQHGLEHCILRLANVYGPRNEHGVISLFRKQIEDGNEICVNGGDQVRDFIHVSDVVSAVKKAVDLRGTFNVSTGIETKIIDLAHTMAKKSKAKIVKKPYVKGEAMYSCMHSMLLRGHGWAPENKLTP